MIRHLSVAVPGSNCNRGYRAIRSCRRKSAVPVSVYTNWPGNLLLKGERSLQSKVATSGIGKGRKMRTQIAAPAV